MSHEVTSTNFCCDNAFQAVRSNHIQCLNQMNKLDLEQRDINGLTPLHVAAKLGRLEAIDLLLHEAPRTQDAVSVFGESPALVAAGEGQKRSIELLFKKNSKHTLAVALQQDINGTSVLMAAVARGDMDLALWLLRRFGKTLVILPNNFRMLPLHVAAAQGNIEFIRNAVKYDHRMVNYRDHFGCTPVFYAVQGGCLICARYLIEKAGADICVVSDRGQSLLHIACLAGHAHIVRWIMHRSTLTTILWTTKDNANAIHCASYSGSVAALEILLHIIPQKRRRRVLALRDSRGNTPLHLAAINNHTDAAQYLLENGAKPQLLNSAGQTPIAIARIRRNYQLIKLLSYWEERKQKKTKGCSPSLTAVNSPYINNTYSSGYWTIPSPTLPNGSSYTVPLSRSTLPLLPQNIVSKHSSRGSLAYDNPIYNEVSINELRPITYIASDEGGRIYKDHSVQTDCDSLKTAIKILEIDEWRESLAAVAQIDRVLQEIDA